MAIQGHSRICFDVDEKPLGDYILRLNNVGVIYELSKDTATARSNKKVQQSWQTSALAMHLPLARLVSMSVIFCLLSSSGIVIPPFYLFPTDIVDSMCENWECEYSSLVSGLTLPLRGSPLNNAITFVSPVQSVGYIFCRRQYMQAIALQISEQFSPKARTPTH